MEPENPLHTRINYLYFGIYCLFLVLMSASSVFAKENLSGSRIFFFLYAAGQALLETSLFIFFGWLLRKFTNRMTFFFFIGATFAFFILHILDFLMDRILDLSVWGTISVFVINETFNNFLYLLDASGIPIWTWILLFGALAALPLLGILLYKISEVITERRPLLLRLEVFPIAFFCLPAALFFWDFSGSRLIHPNTYTAFLQSLPWKFTFLEPANVTLSHLNPLLSPPEEQQLLAAIENQNFTLNKKPNIYLFVIESLRTDILTEKVAPHLFAFQKTTAPAELTLSNANASHLSWFSIFHSQFSHNWNFLQQKNWKMGSAPLNMLKKLGYQIRLYSSAQLGYYGMEKLLFGENNHLVDSFQTFHHTSTLSASETDAQTLRALQKDLSENPSLQEGQLFIIFWDATHFDYSWPKNWAPKFTPFANELAYFKAFYSHAKIELIKNRYRNAFNYMDSLFGEFISKVPNKKEAVIIVTGDHGEEFFEHGHLFHGSHLTHEQTSVPLLMKFGENTPTSPRKIISQIDIFPSLLDYLTGTVPQYLQGQSIFREELWPFAAISRFNAGRTPYEFCLHNGKHKLVAQFSNRTNILNSKTIQIVSLSGKDDKTLPDSHDNIPAWVEQEFGAALKRLFP